MHIRNNVAMLKRSLGNDLVFSHMHRNKPFFFLFFFFGSSVGFNIYFKGITKYIKKYI